ncbi:hypothetical protein EMPS_01691 [Entomortierella parvispora]|uniref:Uncharacterized protein n=1 Tax=Entomortierella parvispora TaxID=205924 RepID=A0A9P3H3B0_9FUNG|nr:hypothetical protein EMPS_01691 [Entomortierella parvispora]
MQFKTLALAAVAVAATTVSAYDSNACTACVYASIPKDSVCATLNSTALNELVAVFGSTSFNLAQLSGLVQDPSIKACVCHWANTAFTPSGSAASCTTGTPATCNSTQVGQAAAGIAPVVPGLGCSAASVSGGAVAPSGASPSATGTGSAPAATTKAGSAASSINIPYVVSIAAVGLAALAGF